MGNSPSSQNSNSVNQEQTSNKTELFDKNLSPEWEWQSNQDPWSAQELPQWTKYSLELNQVIETAFQKKQDTVDIGAYMINLTDLHQIHKEQTWRVRPVRRMQRSQRSLRFCSELINPKTFGRVTYSGDPTIIEKWLNNKKFNFKIDNQGFNITDEEDMPQLKEVVALAIKGILEEAKKENWTVFAEMIAKRLEINISQNPKMIFRECIYAYTQENHFGGPSLYTVANRALREIDYSKIETLGPYCYLLHFATKALSCGETEFFSAGKVYRGLALDENMLEMYNKAWKRGLQISFHSFVSTSKDEAVARNFSNISANQRKVLLVIENLGGAYVESLTSHIGEQEVLLPASRGFEITDICEGDVTIISLKMMNTKLESASFDAGDASKTAFLLSHSSFTELPPILQEWGKDKNIYFEISADGRNITPESKSKKLKETFQLAVEGMRRHMKTLKLSDYSKKEADKMVKKLLEAMKSQPQNVFKVMVESFTRPTFLCEQIEKILKSESSENLTDFGAYAYLMSSYLIALNLSLRSEKSLNFVNLYYCVSEKKFPLSIFEELHAKNLHFAFSFLAEASRDPKCAQMYLNSAYSWKGKKGIAFLISVPERMASAFDITHISCYPAENLVIIPPNISFRITNIDYQTKEFEGSYVEIKLEFIDYII